MSMSITSLGAACGAAFLLALVACGLIRDFAARRALVDLPNERSLHSLPVPRLGGVGIAAAVWAVMGAVLALTPGRAAKDVLVWLAASIVTAATGLVDDLRPVSAGARMAIQCVIALGFTLLIGAPSRIVLAEGVALSLPVWATTAISVIWIVGVLNIYNFMDGMDGLAGAQAIGAGLAVAVGLAAHGHTDLALLAGLLAAASAGFFVHNVGPARIFMGDAGSTMIGFTFAALALAAQARPDPLPFPVVPLSLAPFLLDGTFTLLRRASRGEAVWKAHRSHLYQRAVTSGLTHRDVLGPYTAWIGAAALASVTGARAGGLLMPALGGAMLAGLYATFCWVRRIEEKA
jgi:UDP-N-acetylmuramyl pentapeptide phosphotransferase/UDP-N-acetylglucosamine-1-phosphate transferase